MTGLSDTQAILLPTASQRPDGSVLPLPATMKPGGGAARALASLLKGGPIAENPADDPGTVHRSDGDLTGEFNRSSRRFKNGGVRWTSRNGFRTNVHGHNGNRYRGMTQTKLPPQNPGRFRSAGVIEDCQGL